MSAEKPTRKDPQWYSGLDKETKDKLTGGSAIDEELYKLSGVHSFGLLYAGPSKAVVEMFQDVTSEDSTTATRVETLIHTVKRLEEEGRKQDIQLANAIAANEVRASAALDAAAFAQHTAVDSGNAANDSSRCYSKQCLVFSGPHMPDRVDRFPGDDGVKHLIDDVIKDKMGITVARGEIATAHYKGPKGTDIIARFTLQCQGSVFQRCLDISRSLSVRNQDKSVTREVKIWARINESGQDAHISYLLRQMEKVGQATGINVTKAGKVTALVKYGAAPEEFRRMQFTCISDVREVMNRKAREQEKLSDAANNAKRAEAEYNRHTGMAMFKLTMSTAAEQKRDYRMKLSDKGRTPQLTTALRIGIGMDVEDRLKYLTWKSGPNSAFGITTEKPTGIKKRGREGDTNQKPVGYKKSKTRDKVNLDLTKVNKALQDMADSSETAAAAAAASSLAMSTVNAGQNSAGQWVKRRAVGEGGCRR
jgi:hypothetical protein